MTASHLRQQRQVETAINPPEPGTIWDKYCKQCFSKMNLQLSLILRVPSKYCLLIVHISFKKYRHFENDPSFQVDCTIPEHDISFELTRGKSLLNVYFLFHS